MDLTNGLLEQKVCLVTGTNRGIGQKIAERFAEEGSIVYANARQKDCLEEWAFGFNEKVSGNIIPIYFDITNSEEIKQAMMRLKKEQGRMDVLVNNAGIISNSPLGMIAKDSVRNMFEVNVFGLLDLTQYVVTKFMIKQKSGSVINIASITGVEGSKGQIAYSASKGAVISLTKSMAQELAIHNIRINAVAPGMVDTGRIKVTLKKEYCDNVPPIGMGRLGRSEEIADACLYFAQDTSGYTTGQVLVVSGGYDTQSRTLYNINFD
ncbi:SDR family NAD(P)-dependent oxidoreductase [Parablautia muri]|nr:SDR family oxidoreductase [Parablautia muri]